MKKTQNVDGPQDLQMAYRDLKQSLVLQDAHIMELISLIQNQRKNVLGGLIQAFGLSENQKEQQLSSMSATDKEPESDNETLCSFIHPAVERQQERKIHNEIKSLVRRQRIQEICSYLLQMRKENKVLLPISPQVAYTELVRMGMPETQGFNESTFRKYYRN